MALFIGLMSGTSLDGVDGVLAEFADATAPVSLAHVHRPMPAALRAELLRLNDRGDDELHRAALAANALVELYALAVGELLQGAQVSAQQICAIGAHGQTVRHRPLEFDGVGYTSQLMNGALLAERTGIDTVCDFRTRDLAAGGQGAPLVPAFHAAMFGGANMPLAVLNIGGIANLSLLGIDGQVRGFDCGPGNVLMDLWCQRHQGQAFDRDGRWAASAEPLGPLLDQMLADPFFAKKPPKSTGRDLFNEPWLDAQLARGDGTASQAQIMSTLAELTARAAADAMRRHAPTSAALLVCGGGAANPQLMHRLAAQLPGVEVASTASRGIPADQVEALAFAWLAHAWLDRRPGNLPAVTGARGPRVLGALYPR